MTEEREASDEFASDEDADEEDEMDDRSRTQLMETFKAFIRTVYKNREVEEKLKEEEVVEEQGKQGRRRLVDGWGAKDVGDQG